MNAEWFAEQCRIARDTLRAQGNDVAAEALHALGWQIIGEAQRLSDERQERLLTTGSTADPLDGIGLNGGAPRW